MRRLACGLLLAGLLAAALPARAAPPVRDPDWPCQSIKVPDLVLGTVWTGPPVDAFAQTWQQDEAVAAFARRITQRRVPLDQAQADIRAFADAAGEARSNRLLALMAGVFDLLNTERSAVLSGLDRFGARQKDMAGAIRAESADVSTEQASPNADADKLNTMMQRLQLDTRVFDARRQALQYACAVPATIEQRLFGLAHAIQQALPAHAD